jgi:hypothetical protein
MNLLIGADPEFFLKDKETGKFVSAHGMIEGTKKNPQKVEGGAVQVDGMALEFNIDPAKSFNEFDTNLTIVLRQLRQMIDDKYEFAFVPVAEFGEEYINNQPEEARILGCDPDFNAYTGKPNPTPNAKVNFRTASGHLHFGWTENEDIKNPEHIEACEMLVKQLDTHIGLASIIVDRDTRRRELYGKAGAYRPKPYGVEYRTPSNFWVGDKELRQMVWDYGVKMFDSLLKGLDYSEGLGKNYVQRLINQSLINPAYENLHMWYQRPAVVSKAYKEWKRNLEVKLTVDTGTASPWSIPNEINLGNLRARKQGRPIARNEFGQFAPRQVVQPVLDIEVANLPPVPPPIPRNPNDLRWFDWNDGVWQVRN